MASIASNQPSLLETPAANQPSFEVLVTELEKLVGQLEGGQLSLEDSLAAFERGMSLSKSAAGILDAAEHRIEQLTGTPENTVLKTLDDSEV